MRQMLVNFNAIPGFPRASGGLPGLPEFPDFQDFAAGVAGPGAAQNVSPEAAKAAGDHFYDILQGAINDVNAQQSKVEQLAVDVATGKDIDPHVLMIENAKAETMIHMTSSVATKMAQDFQTLMNLQI